MILVQTSHLRRKWYYRGGALDARGKRLKKKGGLFTRKLISRGFLVVKEAYPSPSFVYYIYPKTIQTT